MAFVSRIPFHQVFRSHPETCLAGEELEISRPHPGAESEVESEALKTEKKIKCRIQKDRMVIGEITLSFRPREIKHLLLRGSNISEEPT